MRAVEFEISQIYDTRDRVSDFVVRRPHVEASAERCSRGLPAPPRDLQLGYAETDRQFFDVGRSDMRSVAAICESVGFTPAAGERVLDFGCAAGRLTRWVTDSWPQTVAWGVDIDAPRISWARQHLGSVAKFVMTTKLPHLPFADGFFASIFAFSVFSHVDDLTQCWLLELGRVMRPGGVAVLTIMDEHTIEMMERRYSDHALPQRLAGYRSYYENRDFDMFAITRDSVADVWQRSDYFAEMAQPIFDVIRIVPGFHGWQTGVVLRRA